MKGKPWSVDEEKQLRELVAAKTPMEVIAAKLGRCRDAVTIKCKRLGLEVVVANCYSTTTTSLKVPEELPSVEEALLKLAGALEAACKPGLDKVEVQRLQVVASIAKTYKDILADYF
jgi:aspartate aminotransferase-like enzyme